MTDIFSAEVIQEIVALRAHGKALRAITNCPASAA